jgi:hypothetical protein
MYAPAPDDAYRSAITSDEASGLDRRDFPHHRRTGRWVDIVEIRDHVGADVALVLGLRVLQHVGQQRGHAVLIGAFPACEPPRRLLVMTREPDQPAEQALEVTLTADGNQTIVVWEEQGMPVAYLAGYGAGIQVHVEDLAAYLAGRERCDADARMAELFPADEDLAAKIGLGPR